VTTLSRRDLLRAGGAAGIGLAAAGRASYAQAAASQAAVACTPKQLSQIEHIVFFMQENRSFDHYFGSYPGVRGFDDRTAPGGAAAFKQPYTTATPTGYPNPMLPFHLDTAVSLPPKQGECTNDIEHQWAGQHDAWNHGANDRWMTSHLATEPDALQAAITMGYYNRADLAFYYALADHFTIGDAYHCSMIAGTDINRLYEMTGTIDPDGWDGGCQFLNTKIGTIQNPGADLGAAGRWIPYPQILTKAGISWKCYSTADGQLGDNVLRYFPQFRPVGGDSTLSAAAFSSNAFPADFAADCASGQLPQVSWLLANLPDTEHAPAPPEWGMSITHDVLTALMESPAWAKTVLFLMYDENGGFFDHVPPLTAPAGTAGEYLNQKALSTTARQEATTVKGVDTSNEPIGLGYRVPLIVISPWSRNPQPGGGPLVDSTRYDHTSLLRFVETWSYAIGKPAPIPARNPLLKKPGLSPWRRSVVGDLTATLSFGRPADASAPTDLLSVVPNRADPRVLTECTVTGTLGSLDAHTEPIVQDPTIPSSITQPAQEKANGAVRRPVAEVCSTGSHSTQGSGGVSGSGSHRGGGHLANSGGSVPAAALTAVGAAAAALLALRRRLDRNPGDATKD
jgi:phospholipase C